MSTPDGSGDTEADEILAVDVVLKLGALLLSAGSPTDDVERSMRVAAASVGLERATAAVTFGTGAAVAFGDIVVQTLRHVRDEIIEPVIVHPIGQVVQSGIQAVTGHGPRVRMLSARPRTVPRMDRPTDDGVARWVQCGGLVSP